MDRPLNRQFPSPLILVTRGSLVPNFSPTWECGILVLHIMRDTLSQTAFLCVRTRGRNVKSSPDCSTLSTVILLLLVSFPSEVMSGSSLTFIICSKKSSFRIFWAKCCVVFRWFKFTLKPPYRIAISNFFLAIWDTSHWNFLVKFGLKTA